MLKRFAFIIILCVFSSCSNNDYEKLITEQSKSLEKGFELIDKDLNQLKQETFYLLSDEAKHKYRPIKGWIERTSNEFFKVYDWIRVEQKLMENDHFNWSGKTSELKLLLEKLKISLDEDYQTIMNDHGLTFGLKEDEINKWMDENRFRLTSTDSLSFWLNQYNKSSNVSEEIITKVKYDLKVLEKKLISRMVELSGGRGIRCNFGIFPRVFSRQNIVKMGEVFTADIVIHPYDHGILLSNLEIKVNGELINFEDGRYFKYVSEPIQESQQILIISGKVRSNITGKFETAFPDFEYTINTTE